VELARSIFAPLPLEELEPENAEAPKAAERKGQAPGQPRGSKKLSPGNLPDETERIGHGDVRDLVGSAVGMSGQGVRSFTRIPRT
jgi:hypothetical protein